MPELTTLVPVLNRPENVQPLVESWRATTPGKLLFLASDDDQAEIDAIAPFVGDDVYLNQTPVDSYPSKMNHGAEITDAEWLFLAADDVRFHPGWWEATEPLRETGHKVIGTNDLANPRVLAGRHSTHTLVHRSYVDEGTVDEPGKVCHEGYRHWYVDDELIGTAKARGVFVSCPEAVVEHLHPMWGKGEEDATYRIGYDHRQDDKALWESRKPLVYQAARPFPHLVWDDFADCGSVEQLLAEFPAESDPRWKRYENDHEFKCEGSDRSMWGPKTRETLKLLSSPEFRARLEHLTGVPELRASTVGGGYHLIPSGGHLDIHADFNRYGGLYRRLNLLLFLNPGWEDEWGGLLELWGSDGPVQKIAPEAGRLVLFSTSSVSYHGHPEPLKAPMPRRSIAVYYFSPAPPENYQTEHSTVWA